MHDAYDSSTLCIRWVQIGHPVDIPVYDFKTHSRSKTETRRIEPSEVIILEGILVLHMDRIRELLHMKIFVDTDDDVRLARRLCSELLLCSREWHPLLIRRALQNSERRPREGS